MRIHKNRIVLSKSETIRWYGNDLYGKELPKGPDGKLHELGRAMGQALSNFLGVEVSIHPYDYPIQNVLDSFSPKKK